MEVTMCSGPILLFIAQHHFQYVNFVVTKITFSNFCGAETPNNKVWLNASILEEKNEISIETLMRSSIVMVVAN